jgi:hypothetical protein
MLARGIGLSFVLEQFQRMVDSSTQQSGIDDFIDEA